MPTLETPSARKTYLDIAKLIAIFVVVLDHAQYQIHVDNRFKILRIGWLSNEPTIFFFILSYTKEPAPIHGWDGWKKLLGKSFRTIIIPFFFGAVLLGSSRNFIFLKNV